MTAAAAVALPVALVLRRTLPAPVAIGTLSLCGAAMAWGGMLMRPDPSTGEVVLAVAALALLLPAHVRVVLGPFGTGRWEGGTGAREARA